MIHHYLIHECGLRPDAVAVALKGWEILPIVVDGNKVGEAMLKGSEIHVSLSRSYRKKTLSRRTIREFIGSLLEERVFLVTRSRAGDSTEQFIQRLGFTNTHADKQFNYWWLEKAPFAKE